MKHKSLIVASLHGRRDHLGWKGYSPSSLWVEETSCPFRGGVKPKHDSRASCAAVRLVLTLLKGTEIFCLVICVLTLEAAWEGFAIFHLGHIVLELKFLQRKHSHKILCCVLRVAFVLDDSQAASSNRSAESVFATLAPTIIPLRNVNPTVTTETITWDIAEELRSFFGGLDLLCIEHQVSFTAPHCALWRTNNSVSEFCRLGQLLHRLMEAVMSKSRNVTWFLTADCSKPHLIGGTCERVIY